ncbi:HNH endonuclease [Micromonospora sp. NBS 11-29]|uniref:HNH endonuclease n=1 Tax=Micromonospora sp. NBS 11-29 TaxID=1960879 RepID=UPI000B77344D|nr:HNH endonuclease [Micromonospora sp. NBS 11-29]
MALIDITRTSVLKAMAEFDRLGRDGFLKTYGFGRALSYFLEYEQKSYDSKAIVGYAHGELYGRKRWTSSDFTGGELTVARHLRDRLGFTVLNQKAIDWTRDEIIMACDLVASNEWRELRAHHSSVIELSDLLQKYWMHTGEKFSPSHRNPNSVSRKTTDIASRHPDYTGRATRGSKLDRIVLADFLAAPQEMHRQARAIRKAISEGWGNAATDSMPDAGLSEASVQEGGILERMHFRRDRDKGIRDKAIKRHKSIHGFVACQACGFNFAATYGPRGEDYIECHHRVPLSESGETVTRVTDFVLLCSNCHRMIHRVRPWITVDQLIEILARANDERAA